MGRRPFRILGYPSTTKSSLITAAPLSRRKITTTKNLYICEVSYTLKSAGRRIQRDLDNISCASGTLPDPGWIAAAGEATRLELPVNVPYDFLISLMRDVGRDWDIDYELEVGLTIDLPAVGNFAIPLSTKGELKLPTLKDIF